MKINKILKNIAFGSIKLTWITSKEIK